MNLKSEGEMKAAESDPVAIGLAVGTAAGEDASRKSAMLKKVAIGLAVGTAAGTAAVALAPLALGAAGFGAGGVVAGSIAASVQSVVYGGATCGVFSLLQSAGAAGIGALASGAIVGAGAATGVVAGAAAGAADGAAAGAADCADGSNGEKAETGERGPYDGLDVQQLTSIIVRRTGELPNAECVSSLKDILDHRDREEERRRNHLPIASPPLQPASPPLQPAGLQLLQAMPDGQQTLNGQRGPYDGLEVQQLKAIIARRTGEVPNGDNVNELIAVLDQLDQEEERRRNIPQDQ